MAETLRLLHWGRTRYRDAWARQRALVAQRLEDSCPDTVVFTEHAPVYTLGARAGADRHLVWDAAARAQAGIEVVETNRGGDVTYHGPGQLVGYPIIDWRHRADLHAYLRELEGALIEALAELGLTAERRPGLTGLWIGPRKLVAIGVAVRRWITYHGFALNVAPRLDHFSGIVPCGIDAETGTVTSLERELGTRPDPETVETAVWGALRNWLSGPGTRAPERR